MGVHKVYVLQILNVNDGPDFVIRRNLQKVLNGSSLSVLFAFGNFVNVQPVTSSLLGKEQHGMVRAGNEQVFDVILVSRFPAHHTTAAAALCTKIAGRCALDVTK